PVSAYCPIEELLSFGYVLKFLSRCNFGGILYPEMRTVIRAVKKFRPAFWCRGNFIYVEAARKQDVWFNINICSLYSLSRNVGAYRCRHPSYMISRAISADAAKVTNGEVSRDGPLVEYERRIAAGELLDGDACQQGTLGELQRLYDELVANAEACRLDRYATSQKAGRSRWLWSRFIPQTSYAPVKGLYLYGGVGTGKTMLMDLFYDQLPCNWRKKRIHFHDFMLNVHSRLQNTLRLHKVETIENYESDLTVTGYQIDGHRLPVCIIIASITHITNNTLQTTTGRTLPAYDFSFTMFGGIQPGLVSTSTYDRTAPTRRLQLEIRLRKLHSWSTYYGNLGPP
ncbi:UNVERIFIED_CONTAM: protein AFG1, partial [Sesamum calycinum]